MNPISPSTPHPRTVAAMRASIVEVLPDLKRRAARLALDPSAADDLVQDTVERALRFADHYDPGSNLRGWAYQVLYSVFVTGYRRRRRERRCLEVLTTTPSAWTRRSPFPSPEAQMGQTRSTAAAVAALPPAFRDAVTLVDLGQHTYREAADLLGVPLGTVMSRLHRGRRMLAERLGDDSTGALAA